VNALNDIADGNTGPAATKVETSLAGTIPLLLRFLAGQLGLSGIGASIRKIIDDIRKPIDDTIEKVLDIVVDGARDAWNAGKAAFMSRLDAVKEWWNKPLKFNMGEDEHELTVEGDGDHPEVFVHSDKTPLVGFLDKYQVDGKKRTAITAAARNVKWKKDKPQTLKDTDSGYDRFDALRKLMNKIRVAHAPKSIVKDDNAAHSDHGGGLHSHAFLGPVKADKGSSPSGADPAVWTDLGYLREYGEKHYVRGHLVSEELGGHGKWTNMMPITNGANQRMEVAVESFLKEQTDPGKKNPNYYFYEVKATYGTPRVPSLANCKTQADLDNRSDEAEKRLQRMSWTVKAAEIDDSGNWIVDNRAPKDADGKTVPAGVRSGSFNPRLRKDPKR
jgi:hypothetical protein